VLAQRKGCGDSNAGTRLRRSGVRYARHTRCTPVPKVAIEREPKGRPATEVLRVITQVTFEGADRAFRLGLGCGNRKELLIRGEEPYATVAIQQPFAETLRVAKLRLEGPAVNPPVDHLRGIILSGWRDYFQADAQHSLLLPFYELRDGHRRTALQVQGKAKS